MGREPTFSAEEKSLGAAIGLGDMSADGACAGCVVGINQYDGNPFAPGLVFDKGSKLEEGPGMLDASLRLPNRDSLSYPLQVFEGYTFGECLSLRNQRLADLVIDVSLEPGFFPTSLFEQPFGGLRAFGLEFSPKLGMALPKTVDYAPAVDFSLGVRGKVDDAQIHADVVRHIVRRRFRHVNGLEQEEHPIPVHQIGLSPDAAELGFVVRATYEGDQQTALEGENGHTIRAFPREDMVIVDYRSVGTELDLLGFVPFVGFRHLADHAYGHLSGQAKLIADRIIALMVEPDLAGGSQSVGYLRDKVTGFVEPFHCF